MTILANNDELIDGLLSGDESVFKAIFDQYYKLLVIQAYQVLRDENISKDAVQEVFFELWKNRNKLHHKIILKPYLKRSVTNRSLNILKSRKHHMSSGNEPLSYLMDKSRQPDEIVQDIEFNQVVVGAIDKMPDRCRAVYLLSRNEGLTHAEISEKLEISSKTIENQITKALKIIRNDIKNYKKYLIFLGLFFLAKWGILHFELFTLYHPF